MGDNGSTLGREHGRSLCQLGLENARATVALPMGTQLQSLFLSYLGLQASPCGRAARAAREGGTGLQGPQPPLIYLCGTRQREEEQPG
jgi:hypothetical protein